MKIWITGSSGSGKSTLSKQISDSLNIKVYHSDHITWQENWVLRDKSAQLELINDISSKDQWIFDGNKFTYSKRDGRYETCDVLIHIETNRFVCLFRVVNRFLKHRNDTREDLAQGCEENLDMAHLKQVFFKYPKAKRWRKSFFEDLTINRKNIQVLTNKTSLERWIKKNNIK